MIFCCVRVERPLIQMAKEILIQMKKIKMTMPIGANNVSNRCEWWQEMLCACREGHQTLVKRFHARGGYSDPTLWIEKWGELPLSVPVLVHKQ